MDSSNMNLEVRLAGKGFVTFAATKWFRFGMDSILVTSKSCFIMEYFVTNKNIIDVIDPFPDIFDNFDSLFIYFF